MYPSEYNSWMGTFKKLAKLIVMLFRKTKKHITITMYFQFRLYIQCIFSNDLRYNISLLTIYYYYSPASGKAEKGFN